MTQTETFKITVHMQVHFYSVVLTFILHLDPKSNDDLKPHLYVLIYYIVISYVMYIIPKLVILLS